MSTVATLAAAAEGERSKPGYVDFVSGWSAGCIETIVLYPQNKVIFRQQLHGLMIKDALLQLKTEGMPLLYRGLLPPLLMRTTTRSIMFGMFEKYQHILDCGSEGVSPKWKHFSLCHAQAAFLAGFSEALLCPLERLQVLLQTSAHHSRFKNTHGAFQAVYSHGIREFYRGFSLVIFRNGFSNTLFFTLRDPLKHEIIEHVPRGTEWTFVHLIAEFTSGAVLGACISTLFFPVNVVKTRMQAALGTPYESPATVFRIVWRERNRSLKELFRGVQLNFTRSLLAWGITNTAFECIKRIFE
uniref:Solute carrier family 25 member 51 n=2 Tax=Panagrellus redivivus TaxID=6233 RepID=A0A7E4V516_PANRE